jgi:hypothetical protein
MAEAFYSGETARGRVLISNLDPITGNPTPNASVSSLTIRFINPDGTILATRTIGGGVVNAGAGYYYGDAIPVMPGLHTVEFESLSGVQGREKVTFGVKEF